MIYIITHIGHSFKLYEEESGEQLLSARWDTLLGSCIGVVKDLEGSILYTIKTHFSIWKWRFKASIKKNIGLTLFLESKNGWHNLYELYYHGVKYSLKIHKGRKKSVFKNDLQIAVINEALVEHIYRDKIKIETNSPEDIEIIFAMIFSLKIGNDKRTGLTFDFGQIGKTQPIDNEWIP